MRGGERSERFDPYLDRILRLVFYGLLASMMLFAFAPLCFYFLLFVFDQLQYEVTDLDRLKSQTEQEELLQEFWRFDALDAFDRECVESIRIRQVVKSDWSTTDYTYYAWLSMNEACLSEQMDALEANGWNFEENRTAEHPEGMFTRRRPAWWSGIKDAERRLVFVNKPGMFGRGYVYLYVNEDTGDCFVFFVMWYG